MPFAGIDRLSRLRPGRAGELPARGPALWPIDLTFASGALRGVLHFDGRERESADVLAAQLVGDERLEVHRGHLLLHSASSLKRFEGGVERLPVV